ncbi:MAG TPA: hypothetical protein VLF66_20805 [Thermoanaerobaculia bacterium]|nr:hypothetical protein [Thermoanaerobaculia bacterium]
MPRPVHRTPALLAAGAALLAALSLPAAAPALDLNGFLPAAGEGAAALSYTAESYDEFWAGETKVQEPALGEVETSSLSLWFRWGFTDRLSVVANLPYVDVSTDGFAGLEDDGLADLEALLLFRLLETSSGALNHRLVAGAGVRTPASDYEGNAPISLGDDTTDALLRLVYQLQNGGFYVSQQVGYDLRSDDAPDNFPLFTEVGYTYGAFTFSGFYKKLVADGGTDIGDPGFTFPSNQEEYERVGAKVFGRFTDRIGGALSAFTTLDGRNTGQTTGVSAGIVLDF